MLRWILGSLFSLCVICASLGLSAYVGWIWIGHKDFASFVSNQLSKTIHRTVIIDHFYIHPGEWVTVEINGLHIGNIPEGSRPDIIFAASINTKFNLKSLFYKKIDIDYLNIDHFTGVFERTLHNGPNWRFTIDKIKPNSHNTVYPSFKGNNSLSWLPFLHKILITNSRVIYRSRNDREYKVDLKKVNIETKTLYSPTKMIVHGGYNNIGNININANMASLYNLYKNYSHFNGKFLIYSDSLKVNFDGTFSDILSFNGVSGKLFISTPTSQTIFKLAGLQKYPGNIDINLKSIFKHENNLWELKNAFGNINDSQFSKSFFSLIEGSKKKPDNIILNMHFNRLDTNFIIQKLYKKNETSNKNIDVPLIIPQYPDPIFKAQITAKELFYNTLDFSNFKLALNQIPNQISIPTLQLNYLNSSIESKIDIIGNDSSSNVNAAIFLSHANIDDLRRIAGLTPIPIQGTLSLHMLAHANDIHTLNEILQKTDLQAAVSIEKGEIAREIVEAASMDLRLLFRHAKGTTPITCMLGVLNLQKGKGSVVPLRIKTQEGIIAAKTEFDLSRKWMDLVFASRPFSTSFFALDIPIRVSGPFDHPKLGLALWSKIGRHLLADANSITALPPELQGFVASNPCVKPTH